jgi:cytidine deaminase
MKNTKNDQTKEEMILVDEIGNSQINKEMEKTLKNSYSPYSKIKVACVLEFADGSTFCGCNVENASYPCGLCAERNAIFGAIAHGKDVKKVVEVHIASDQESMFFPCGACRQVLSEHLNVNTRISVYAKVKKSKQFKKFTTTLLDLLPFAFKL